MINISVEDIGEAVETLKEIIIPWRRQNERRKANLESALRQAEIQRLNGETLLAQAKVERERAATKLDDTQAELVLSQVKKTEAEAEFVLAQAEKTRAEANRERANLRQSQIELAIQIVERYASDVGNIQKMDYVIRLIPILDRLISSDIELVR